MNWFAIISNLSARSSLLRLAEPVRAPGARPLDPGRPVWQRPGMIVVAGAALLVIVVVVYDALTAR